MAANNYTAIYKRFNGTDWDTFYFATLASQVSETTNKRFMTDTQRTNINAYLVPADFNKPNKLLKLDTTGFIPIGLIPGGLEYLPLDGGRMENYIDMDNYGLTFQGSSVINSTGEGELRLTSEGKVIFIGPSPSFGDLVLEGVANPTEHNHAANKEYVDNLVSAGFKVKSPVKAASVAPITISTALSALDGYTLAVGDRVLLKNQTNTSQNGVYELNSSKIPQKVEEDSVLGVSVFVEHGNTQNDYIFVHNEGDGWVIFSKPDTIKAGAGLSKTGTTLYIPEEGITGSMIEDYSINSIKLEPLIGGDWQTAWSQIDSADNESEIEAHLGNIQGAIKLLRGTANYNTNNTQTIAGAYTVAGAKNRTYVGSSNPSGSNYVEGDLYFQGNTI